MTTPVQIPDAAVQALEALKKAEIFIENGVEYGFIRLPEKPDPALDTLPKIKAAIAALTNEGTKPVDVAAVRRQAFEEAAKKAEELLVYADTTSHADKVIPAAIRALSAEPAQGEQWHDIATAPKDGTDVLLKRTMGRPEIVGGYFDGAWRSFDQPDKAITDVTHWMPLPAAPTPEAEA